MMFRPRTAKDWPTTPPMEILSDLPGDLSPASHAMLHVPSLRKSGG